MRITWINPAPIVETNGQKSSVRACVRLRSMIPGNELAREGHDISQISLDSLKASMTSPEFFQRDVFVFGKAFADVSPVMKKIHAVTGARIIVDICDNIFAPPEDGLKHIYQAILPHADAIVASSEMLKEALSDDVPDGIPVYMIVDAVEGERISPVFKPLPGVIRLLWFGYPNNLPLLLRALTNLSLLTTRFSVELAIVTAWPSDAVRKMFPDSFGGVRIRRAEWSLQSMRDELQLCDIVIVPSDASQARLTKSANRVITGLWAGKYVVGYPLPSYKPFGDFASIGRDLVAGIQWALDNRDLVLKRVERGQRFIWQHYNPDIIAKSWETVFNAVAKSQLSSSKNQ